MWNCCRKFFRIVPGDTFCCYTLLKLAQKHCVVFGGLSETAVRSVELRNRLLSSWFPELQTFSLIFGRLSDLRFWKENKNALFKKYSGIKTVREAKNKFSSFLMQYRRGVCDLLSGRNCCASYRTRSSPTRTLRSVGSQTSRRLGRRTTRGSNRGSRLQTGCMQTSACCWTRNSKWRTISPTWRKLKRLSKRKKRPSSIVVPCGVVLCLATFHQKGEGVPQTDRSTACGATKARNNVG